MTRPADLVLAQPCGRNRRSVTAARLRRQHDLGHNDIAFVTATMLQGTHDALYHRDPDMELEGKFSMCHAVTAAIATEQVALGTLDDANIDDPNVQVVRERAIFNLDGRLLYATREATAEVDIQTGDILERMSSGLSGTADGPLSNSELREKPYSCATRRYGTDQVEAAHDQSDALCTVGSAGELACSL